MTIPVSSTLVEEVDPSEVAKARDQIARWLPPDLAKELTSLPPELLKDIRLSPEDPIAAEADLNGSFAAKTLLATFCFEPAAGERPRLISGLRTERAPVFVMRDPKTAIYAIAADGRSPESPRVGSAYLQDFRIRQQIEACGGVIIGASDVAATASWMRLGLPAVPIANIPPNSDASAQFWLKFNAMRPSKSAAKAQQDRSPSASTDTRLRAVIVVATWNPTSFEPLEDGGRAAAERLRQLSGVDEYDSIGMWAPSDQTLGDFRRMTSEGDVGMLQKVLWESIRNDLITIPPPAVDAKSQEAGTLTELRRRVGEDSRSGLDCEPSAERYLRLVEDDVIAPLLSGPAGPGDENDRPLRFVQAGALRRFAIIELAASQELARGAGPSSRTTYGAELINIAKLILDIEQARHGGRHGKKRRGRR